MTVVWIILMIWGYFIVGFFLDKIVINLIGDDFYEGLITVLWPACLFAAIFAIPFILINKLFDK